MVAAVSPKRPDLAGPEEGPCVFQEPLDLVLTMLCWHDGTQMQLDHSLLFPGEGYDQKTLELCRDVLGPGRFRYAQEGDLDAMRRLLTLEERTAE